MMSDLPNLLTASSILLGVITALYGLFFPAITNVLDTKSETHKIDNAKAYKHSKIVYKTKYLPLLYGSILITLINLPELYRQLSSSFVLITTFGISNTTYDTLKASFILVCFFMIFITIKIISSGIKMKKKINELNPV